MQEYRYGGEWTEKKLTILGKYIAAYRTIFAENPRASYFTTWYVKFIEERLKSIFPHVAKGLVLRNSKNNPLYPLCFCASNIKGGKVAVKIAQDILKE